MATEPNAEEAKAWLADLNEEAAKLRQELADAMASGANKADLTELRQQLAELTTELRKAAQMAADSQASLQALSDLQTTVQQLQTQTADLQRQLAERPPVPTPSLENPEERNEGDPPVPRAGPLTDRRKSRGAWIK